ncbi:MAG: hypothetical protein IPN95_20100 [Bacteroidetes bacterium]|nr:hypothetical protein [Bacteroidota bacterium]
MKEGPMDPANPNPTSLAGFVTALLQEGNVLLAPELTDFEEADRLQVETLMESYHRWDAFHLPRKAPDYQPKAAVWAAEYLYRALQFLLLRNLGAELIPLHLKAFPGEITPESVYSADLLLRNLPHVYDLARSLSPSDPLVVQMQEIASQWPFSAVGIPVESMSPLPDHAGLQLAYADRVIAARDRKLSRIPQLNALIQAAVGSHGKLFWPDFEPLTFEESKV